MYNQKRNLVISLPGVVAVDGVCYDCVDSFESVCMTLVAQQDRALALPCGDSAVSVRTYYPFLKCPAICVMPSSETKYVTILRENGFIIDEHVARKMYREFEIYIRNSVWSVHFVSKSDVQVIL